MAESQSPMAGVADTECAAPRVAEPSETGSSLKPSEAGSKPAVERCRHFRAGGLLPTALCLTKASIGSGILGLAVHAAEVGCLYMLLTLVLNGFLAVVGITMIADAAVATNRWSFEDISEELLHPVMAFFTGVVNVISCFGAAAGYLIVCGQIFVVLTDCSEQIRKMFVILIAVFVCMPLSLAPQVSFVRHLAAAGVTALVLLVVVVAQHAGEEGAHHSVGHETFWFGKGGSSAFTYMNAINIAVYAFNNRFNVPQLTGELTPRPDVGRMTLVGVVSTALAFVMYVAASMAGVLAFGVDDQKDTLVLDLQHYAREPTMIITNFAVMLSVLVCLQLNIYPVRQFCVFAIRKARGRRADDSQDATFRGITLTRWLDMACALAIVMFALLVALVVDEITDIVDLIGAFCSSWMCFVVPPIFYIQTRRGSKSFSWLSGKSLGCLCMCSFGLFCFVFGTYSAIANFVT